MSSPHPALLDLAAGRGLPEIPAAQVDDLLTSAFEHRVSGLLWTRALNGEIRFPQQAASILARHDLLIRSRNMHLWRTLRTVQRCLVDIGVEVTVFKGIATERRWYERLGERRCNDLDLLLDPGAVDRISDVIRALQPQHQLVQEAQHLMITGMLQSLDLSVEGVEVDLHTDLLKVEVPTRQLHVMWHNTVVITGPSGISARVLIPEYVLIHALVHLTKDNFARLSAYADIARILSAENLDWHKIDQFLSGEGLQTHVYSALEEVTSRLSLDRPPFPRPSGVRSALWGVLWPPKNRLQGRLGFVLQSHRPMWISWIAEGRLREAARWWLRRRAFPPRVLVRVYYPRTSGPYLWRLIVGRYQVLRNNRELVAAWKTRNSALSPKERWTQ